MKFRIDLKILFFLGLFLIIGQIKIYLVVIVFTFLHELSHMIVGLILGFKPIEIELMPFGFLMNLKARTEDFNKHILKSNKVELKYIFIALAGPLFNIIVAAILASQNIVSDNGENINFLEIVIYSNFLIFVFNLIPIYPLDGGRIIRSILRIFIGKRNADKSMNIITNISIIILTAIGSIIILYLKNISVVIILIYLWVLVIRENKRFKILSKIRT